MSEAHHVVIEPARTLAVAGACDVLVAGGGVAGIAAAVAAARNGASVWLLERTCGVGGLATLGHVTVWLPLCDGRGRQVCGGLAEEMLKLAVAGPGRERPRAGFSGIPLCWQPGGNVEARRHRRYLVRFNPAEYQLALEAWLGQAGVKLLYDTRVCAVQKDGQRLTHAIVENKSGRAAVACRVIVDATGDADVCYLAGEPTESLAANVPAGWFYYLRDDELTLDPFSDPYPPAADRQGVAGPCFRGDDAESVTAQVLASRERIRSRLAAMRDEHPEADIRLTGLPTLPTFRMTRRLAGAFALSAPHRAEYFVDTVGLLGDWRQSGEVYAIPYRCLCATRASNLLAAGRCISVDASVWDVTRSIPGCVVSGEAAGTAAALASRQTDVNLQALSVEALRDRLSSQGVLLDTALIRP